MLRVLIPYNEAKNLLKYFFTVLLSQEEGFNSKKDPLPSETAKVYLKQKIAGMEVDWAKIELQSSFSTQSTSALAMETTKNYSILLYSSKYPHPSLFEFEVSFALANYPSG